MPGVVAQAIADLMDFNRGRRPFCDFCGRWGDMVKERLIKANNGACICPECVEIAADIVNNERSQAQQAGGGRDE